VLSSEFRLGSWWCWVRFAIFGGCQCSDLEQRPLDTAGANDEAALRPEPSGIGTRSGGDEPRTRAVLLLCALLIVAGALIIFGFFAWVRSRERIGKEALLSTKLFGNRTSNLGLVTQNVQWLMLMGTSFVVSGYLQVVRGYSAIKTGVIFTAATAGILASSLAAGALAKRFQQRTLILVGFVTTIAGVIFLLLIVKHSPSEWAFAPGLLLIGLGLGVMLTPSVNVVQSAFPEDQQSEISGLSRCVSNLGSSLGAAIAGTILISGLTDPTPSYALAMIVVAAVGFIGLGVTISLRNPESASAAR
jgi:predicted MFS family arabinose efflux permease